MKRTLLLIAAIALSLSSLTAQTLQTWELTPLSGITAGPVAATTFATNTTAGSLSRGAGVTASSQNGGFSSTGWFSSSATTTLADAIANNDYYEFTLPISSCFTANVTTVQVSVRGSNTGPNTVTLRSSVDGFLANLGTATVTTTDVLQTFNANLSNVSGTVTFRLYGYGGAVSTTPATGGTLRIGPLASGSEIVINGSTMPLPIMATISGDGNICNSGNTLTIPMVVNIMGGTGPYSMVLSNGSSTFNVSSYTSGSPINRAVSSTTTHTLVSVTDANGCTATVGGSSTATILSNTAIISSALTQPSCVLPMGGAIDLTVTGGEAPFSYAWSNGSTNEDLTGLGAGTYTIVLTDANDCTAEQPFTLNAPSGCGGPCPTLSGMVMNTGCGSNNGSITLDLMGGFAPFTFLWSNGQMSQNISGLAAGTYIVTVTGPDCATPGVSSMFDIVAGVDNVPPTITCPAGIPVTCTSLVPASNIGSVTSSDNCGGIPTITFVGDVTSALPTMPCAQNALITRTYRATDAAANSATCSQLISVIDNIPPTVTMGTIANCYANAAAAEAAALAATTGTDNCATSASLTKAATISGSCPAMITVRMTDPCGNFAEVAYNTAIGGLPPVITAGTIAACYPTAAAAQAAAIAATTVGIGCTGPLAVTSSVSGTCNAVVTVTATDPCAGPATVMYNTKIDNTAPTFIQSPLPASTTLNCKDPLPIAATLTGTDNCGGGAVPNVLWINEIHYDNTGADVNESIEVAGTAGINLSDYQLILYNGNGGVTYNTLTLSGVIPNQSGGFGTLAFSYATNGIQNGGTVALPEGDGIALYRISTNMVVQFLSYEGVFQATNGPATGMMSTNIGVTEPGTDPIGLSLQLTGTGTQSSNFMWTGPVTASAGMLNAGQTITAQPTSIPAIFMQTQAAGSCPGARVITRTWTITDACGLSTTHTQTLTVVDNEPPTLTPAPANLTVSCSAPVPPAPTVIATDDCDPAGIITGPIWINEIHYDNTGNDVNEFIEIAGRAGTNLAGCEIYLYNGNGGGTYGTIPLSGVIPNQSNGFGTISFSASAITLQNGSPDGLALFCNGTVVQFLSYEGVFVAVGGPANGQTSVDIGVSENGTEPIGLSLQLNGNGATYGAFTWTAPATATPGAVNTSQTFPVQPLVGLAVTFTETMSPPSPTCPSAKTITRTWTATDACGNTKTHTQIINVGDVTGPVLVCPPLTVNLPLSGTITITQATVAPTVTDDCSTFTLNPASVTYGCAVQGTTQNFVITATDQCGNVGSCMAAITINPFPRCVPTISISDPCVCLNNATTQDNGQFGEQIKVQSLTGKVWTVTAVSGLFLNTSPAPPAAPIPVTLGTVLTEMPAGSGDYFLNGRHIDALGYSLTVTSAQGEVLSVNNNCQYPNIIYSPLVGPFCLFSPSANLTASTNDLNVISAGFTINGVPATVFNPSALGVGTHTIVYTVNGGIPQAAAPSDPGCVQSVSQIVEVVATPSVLSCRNLVNVSLDGTCQGIVHPSHILQGDYLCFDDYEVKLTLDGVLIPNATLTGAHIGLPVIAEVKHKVSGNTCWGNVFAEDKLAPTVTCPDLTLPCSAPKPALPIASGTQNVTFSDNCGNVVLTSANIEEVDLPCGGSINGLSNISYAIKRVHTASDAHGNISQPCTQWVYFQRANPAAIVFPPDITVTNCVNGDTTPAGVVTLPGSGTGTPLLNGNSLLPNNTECEISVLFNDEVSRVCDGTRVILRTWTIMDWCAAGNQVVSVRTQRITVRDAAAPEFLDFPANITISTEEHKCAADYNLPDVLVTDACSRLKSVQVSYFDVDSIPYAITGTFANFPGNNLWNPDTLAVLGLAQDLPIGVYTFRYQVTDDCGNSSTRTHRVTVQDNAVPVAVCLKNTVASLGSDGTVLIPAEAFDIGSYDACADDVFIKARRMTAGCGQNTNFHDEVAFCCNDLNKTIMVVMRVYDVDPGSGSISQNTAINRSNECMIEVQVQDKLRPTCTPPANVTVNCKTFDPSYWAYGTAIGTDNCSFDSLSLSIDETALDKSCNRGTVRRTWTARDKTGLSSTCSQTITVTYDQDYFIHFPGDVRVNQCTSAGNYGEPKFFRKDCELIASTFTDDTLKLVPDACFKILRKWKVINWCTYNVNGSVQVVPNPLGDNGVVKVTPYPSSTIGIAADSISTSAVTFAGGTPADFSNFWSANQNCYEYTQIISIIDAEKPVIDGTAADLFLNDVTANDSLWYVNSFLNDPVHNSHDLCEGQPDINISASDACTGTNLTFRYLLFLDMNGDGTMETVVNSFAPPEPGFLNVGNAVNPNFSGGSPIQIDSRVNIGSPARNHRYQFAVQQSVAGGKRTARVTFNTLANPGTYILPQLPYGRHKIKWLVADNCGNEETREYFITIRDAKAPTVVCSPIAVNIMPTGMIDIWDTELLQYTTDNCTPAAQLQTAISLPGVNTFPVDASGNPIKSVTFNCTQQGSQVVRIWSRDKSNPRNADYCETTVLVQDNLANACNPTQGNRFHVSGNITGTSNTGSSQPIDQVSLALVGTATGLPQVLMANGNYAVHNAVPSGGNINILPTKDSDHLNGVNMLDVLKVQRHILGLEPLTSNYRQIAADVNNTRSITSSDLVEMRKLILGAYTEFPAVASWRFVPKYYIFPNPNNAFTQVFPEVASLSNVTNHQTGVDFEGIKMGDVTGDVVFNINSPANDRSATTVYLESIDRQVRAGQLYTVHIKAAQTVDAVQFTLNFKGLELVESGLEQNSFAIHHDALTVATDKSEFVLTLRAIKSGLLSDMLSLGSRITKAVAVAGGQALQLDLRFNGIIQTPHFELYQNTPNPFKQSTVIGFDLPSAAKATLEIRDELGRLIYTAQTDAIAGYNMFNVDKQQVASTGMYFYTIKTEKWTGSRQMLRVE